MRTYCIAQGTLLSALWWPKWEGNPKERGYIIHTAESLCCIAETVVKQLYSNNFFFFNSKNSGAKAGGWLGKVKVSKALRSHQITHYAGRMDSTWITRLWEAWGHSRGRRGWNEFFYFCWALRLRSVVFTERFGHECAFHTKSIM